MNSERRILIEDDLMDCVEELCGNGTLLAFRVEETCLRDNYDKQ